jgi:Uma2 family endonuclease
VAFLGYSRWPANKKIGLYVKVAPELVVEVLSSNNIVKDVDDKVEGYRKAGMSLIWVVNEFGRFVEIHTPDGLPRMATINDVLDCGDILPRFQCPVSEIFAQLPTEE